MKTLKLSFAALSLTAALALASLPLRPAAAARGAPAQDAAYGQRAFQTAGARQEGALECACAILNMVNALRAENNAAPLRLDGALCRAARLKAEEMAQRGYFSHTSPVYGSPGQMLTRLGIGWSRVGENIARGYESAASVMEGWLRGEDHAVNMLRPAFARLGVGYSPCRGIWVQVFTD